MPDAHALLARSLSRHFAVCALTAVLLLGGIGGWAAATNLAGAVVAGGRFVVDSHVKAVQHPTGGVVGEIAVHEGQRVAAGDLLLRLDATETRADLAIVTKRLDELRARQARLEAELAGRGSIAFPGDLLARRDRPEVDKAIRNERALFDFRRRSRQAQTDQLAERIAQYEREIEGIGAQKEAHDRGIAVIEEELRGLKTLKRDGLVTVERMNALDRDAATLRGDRGAAVAAQAQTAGRIAETRLQILQIAIDFKSEVGAELREVDAAIGENLERQAAARKALERIDIVAPQGGVVQSLDVHAPGAVISPAKTIMLIVPDRDRLAIEAEIAPRDIDQLHVGQDAILRMTAFNQRTTPELNATVSRIAADLSRDEVTGLTYYLIRVSVPPDEIARLDGAAIVPGMPVELFISTGERSALSYATKPLADQIRRAFREE